jgi:hypothetical protein
MERIDLKRQTSRTSPMPLRHAAWVTSGCSASIVSCAAMLVCLNSRRCQLGSWVTSGRTSSSPTRPTTCRSTDNASVAWASDPPSGLRLRLRRDDDPPSSQEFLKLTLGHTRRRTAKDGAIAYVCMDWRHMRELLACRVSRCSPNSRTCASGTRPMAAWAASTARSTS